jgi:hypothetical protein
MKSAGNAYSRSFAALRMRIPRPSSLPSPSLSGIELAEVLRVHLFQVILQLIGLEGRIG